MDEIFYATNTQNVDLNIGSQFGVLFISYSGASNLEFNYDIDNFASEMIEVTEIHKAQDASTGRYYYYYGFIVIGQLHNSGKIDFVNSQSNSVLTLSLGFVNPDQIQDYSQLQALL